MAENTNCLQQQFKQEGPTFTATGGPQLCLCGPGGPLKPMRSPRSLNTLQMLFKKLMLSCYDYFFLHYLITNTSYIQICLFRPRNLTILIQIAIVNNWGNVFDQLNSTSYSELPQLSNEPNEASVGLIIT